MHLTRIALFFTVCSRKLMHQKTGGTQNVNPRSHSALPTNPGENEMETLCYVLIGAGLALIVLLIENS